MGLSNFPLLLPIPKGTVAKRHPKTLKDLETFALEEFYAILDEYEKKTFQVDKKSVNSY